MGSFWLVLNTHVWNLSRNFWYAYHFIHETFDTHICFLTWNLWRFLSSLANHNIGNGCHKRATTLILWGQRQFWRYFRFQSGQPMFMTHFVSNVICFHFVYSEPTRLFSSCPKNPIFAVDGHNTENVRPGFHYRYHLQGQISGRLRKHPDVLSTTSAIYVSSASFR